MADKDVADPEFFSPASSSFLELLTPGGEKTCGHSKIIFSIKAHRGYGMIGGQ